MTLELAPGIALPADAVSRTIAFVAQKGSGKTYGAMKLAELMLAISAQIVALDPTGVWWGLKAEGTAPGFPILVMGGEHGDLPLEPTAGEIVAEFIVNSGRSVILDLSCFDSRADQNRFLTAFANKLYRLKAKAKTPLHIFMDEADSFIPQRPMPNETAMVGAYDEIVRRGRSRGLGMTLITQRPASLHKNVLSQSDLLVALRIIGTHDHKALSEWTKLAGDRSHQRAFMEALPKLQNGEAYFWSPTWLDLFSHAKINARVTFDSSSTPAVGVDYQPPKLAAVDLDSLSEEILASAAEAARNDPRELKKQIARLQEQLAEKSTKGITPAALRQIEQIEVQFRRMMDVLRRELGLPVGEVIVSDLGAFPPLREIIEHQKEQYVPNDVRDHFVTPAGGIGVPAPDSNGAPLTGAQRRVLRAFFWMKPHRTATPAHIAYLSELAPGSGHFGNLVSSLRTRGYVEDWTITEAGAQALGDNFTPRPSGAEICNMVKKKLQPAAGRMLDVIVSAGIGQRVYSNWIAERVNLSAGSGHFGNLLSTLRSCEAISGFEKDGMTANPIFFLP